MAQVYVKIAGEYLRDAADAAKREVAELQLEAPSQDEEAVAAIKARLASLQADQVARLLAELGGSAAERPG